MSKLVTGKHTNKNTGRQQNNMDFKAKLPQAALFLYADTDYTENELPSQTFNV